MLRVMVRYSNHEALEGLAHHPDRSTQRLPTRKIEGRLTRSPAELWLSGLCHSRWQEPNSKEQKKNGIKRLLELFP